MRAALFRFPRGENNHRLLLAIHHLVIDGVSWRILLEDLQTTIAALEKGEEPRLPAKTTSYQRWAELSAVHGASSKAARELPYWAALAERSPRELLRDGNQDDLGGHVAQELDPAHTRALLQEVPQAYRVGMNDVLLTALAMTVSSANGGAEVLVDLEGHGREDLFEGVDLSRTVGWFTSFYPALLAVADNDPRAALLAVKEQLRAIPGKGVGFGLLKTYADEDVRARLAALPRAAIAFNYLGQTDALTTSASGDTGGFALAPEAGGPAFDPRNESRYPLVCNAYIRSGQLNLGWTHTGAYKAATIESFAAEYLANLKAIVAHCQTPEAGGFTPSDFPLANLVPAELETLCGNDRNIEDLYPLTPAQEGILFHVLAEADRDIYFEQHHFRITGSIDLQAFRRAWEQVVNRHTVLRTSFHWDGLRTFHQVVHRRVTLPWQEHDWRDYPTAEITTRTEALLREDARTGLDCDQAPLLRCQIVRLPDHEGRSAYRFVYSSSHLVMDGWSYPIFFRELFAAYDACRQDVAPDFDPSKPFRDYMAWLARQDREEALDWFRQQLAGFDTATGLPGAAPSESNLAPGEGGSELALGPEVTASLNEMVRRFHLTLNTLIQGAWAILLSRYSGETDVVFGQTVSGRPGDLDGVEDMIGMFINTLPVRVSLGEDTTLVDWLTGIQDYHTRANHYAYTPLMTIQRFSEIPPGAPLFESLVVFENYPIGSMLGERPEKIDDVAKLEASVYPLTLAILPGDDLLLKVHYQTSRFTAASVADLLQRLKRLMASMPPTAANAPIAELDLLSEEERARMLVDWNATTESYPQKGIAALFESRVRQYPDQIAVEMGNSDSAPAPTDFDSLLPAPLTYEDLNEWSGRLAGLLIAEGATPGCVVGLCVPRSPEMLVCILAVLKVGGAYMPLDPDYPTDRLAWMIGDARPALTISVKAYADRFKAATGLLVLERVWPTLADTEALPAIPVAPDAIAYIMYTSGSTGMPKGVLIPQRGVARLVFDGAYAGLDEHSTLLHLSPIAFDASTFDIWGALLRGGRCVLLPPGPFHTKVLRDVIGNQGVDTLFMTTALFHTVVEEDPEIFSGLRYLLTGGDIISADYMERAIRALPATRIVICYGPTECTTYATTYPARLDALAGTPIGGPIGNTRVYILDATLRPVAPTIAGELYLAGDGLAQGYLHRGDLTAERFLPNPFEPHPGTEGTPDGARMYRTGDLVQWLRPGVIGFVGRRDNQVKVRGFRIELGEIEVALQRHERVEEAAVVVHAIGGNKQLVAFVQTSSGTEASTTWTEELKAELRAFLQEHLPEYMVPTLIVPMEALPLTPNQKIDRRALAAQVPRSATADFQPPRTAAERALARIWAQLLHRDRVGINDNFFELGGDSILTIQVISRAREAGYELTPKMVFEHPTISALADRAGTAVRVRAEQGLIAGSAPLTPIQRRFFAMDLEAPDHFNQSVMIMVPAKLDASLLQAAIGTLMRHHDALRLRFHEKQGEWHQEHLPPGDDIPFESHDVSHLDGAARKAEIESIAARVQASLNISSGPLLRAALFQVNPDAGAPVEDNRLLLVVHHLAIDGVSWRILIEDLEAACHQNKPQNAEARHLPAKTTAYKHWPNACETMSRQRGPRPPGGKPWPHVHRKNSL